MKKAKEKNPKRVGVGPMLAWQSRSASQGIVMLVVGYLSIYCTDTLEMPAALVASLLVVSKLLDGVTDVLAGYFVDKTNTKLGRGRPYELCLIGAWLCTWLMFSVPTSFSIVAKSAWILCMYALVNSVFSTFLGANSMVYMVRAFKYSEQYVALNSYGAIITMLAVAAFNIAMPTLVANFATSAPGWSILILCLAIPLTVIGLMRFIFIKETNDVDVMKEDGTKEKITFRNVIQVLKNNKFIYIVALALLVYNFVANMGVGVYYFTYVAHDLSVMSIVSAATVLAIPLMFFVPMLIRKFSTAKLIFAGCFISAAGYFINFFAGENIPMLSVAAILTGLGSVPISMLVNLMLVECADYNEWKGMQRMEGTMGCVTGFATKIGSSFGAGLLGLLLTLTGYVGDVNLIPDSAVQMIRNLYSTIPAVLWIVVALCLLLYKLDDLMPQIQKDNEARRASVLHSSETEEGVTAE